jgi:hypothetical protein
MLNKRKIASKVTPATGPKKTLQPRELMEDINARKKLSPGVCCRALQFVLEYNKDDVFGIQFDTLFNVKVGDFTRVALLYIYRGRNKGRTFIELNYCPFCGKRRRAVLPTVTKKKAKKKNG